MRIIFLVFLFAMPHPALTQNYSERFCIQNVDALFDLGEDPVFEIISVIQTANPANDIYFLGKGRTVQPAQLKGDTLIATRGEFPTWRDADDIVHLPDGEVIGIGGFLGERAFFLQDDATGEFQKIEISGPENLQNVRKLVWSTPLDAILSPTVLEKGARSSLFEIGQQVAHRIDGIDDGITQIKDFPELKLTFLGSEHENRIYIIDADQTIHSLGAFNLDDWQYFKDVFYLADPPRLLIEVDEAWGPFRGLFLVQLDARDGILKPSAVQNFENIWTDFERPNSNYPRNTIGAYDPGRLQYFTFGRSYKGVLGHLLGFRLPTKNVIRKLYRVGDVALIEVIDTNNLPLSSLPLRIQSGIIHESNDRSVAVTRRITMAASKATAFLQNGSVTVHDDTGEVHRLDTSEFVLRRFPEMGVGIYLVNRGEILMAARNGYFLIKDRQVSGNAACDG